jgi:hypothetical protein
MMDCLRLLGKRSGLGPSGVIGKVLRTVLRVPGESPPNDKETSELMMLVGVAIGSDVLLDEDPIPRDFLNKKVRPKEK